MTDIHHGVNMEDSLIYRDKCIEDYWNALDRAASAQIAITAITNHIHALKAIAEGHPIE